MPRWLRVPLALKYFLGLILVQAVTALLIVAWWRTESTDAALTFAALGLASALFAALWLASLARSHKDEALLRAEGHLARERERHKRLTAEERAKAVEQTRRQVQRESRREKNRSNIKLYAAFAGVAGLGTLLLLTQFLSLGVLLISSSGGALAGYLLRMRQEFRRRNLEAPGDAPSLIRGSRLIELPNTDATQNQPRNRDEH